MGAILVICAESISIHVPLAGDDVVLGPAPVFQHISIHVPLAGDDAPTPMRATATWTFLSTSPLRGTTTTSRRSLYHANYFYPRPPCGGRRDDGEFVRQNVNFYPRPPCGGRRSEISAEFYSFPHFYPRPPCGGRQEILRRRYILGQISIHVPLAGDDARRGAGRKRGAISIHVPLAGDDASSCAAPCACRRISIHVPLAGDDCSFVDISQHLGLFLSTSPLRGTTTSCLNLWTSSSNFYPRPPCGGRPYLSILVNTTFEISIHVPLAGDDRDLTGIQGAIETFLSTSPLRGTTQVPFL